jgi:hypothetical protein
MKRTLIITLLLCAVAAIFLRQNDQPDPSNQPDQTDHPLSTAKKSTRSTRGNSPHANDPHPRPLHAITPESLGISSTLAQVHPADVIARAIAEENLPLIHSATLAWFQQDPQAARDWLAQQESLDALQPAISYIAASIGEKGDIPTAMEWLKLLTDDTLRESTLFDIQALALRARRITPEQIITDGLSPERIEELRSGAAGD